MNSEKLRKLALFLKHDITDDQWAAEYTWKCSDVPEEWDYTNWAKLCLMKHVPGVSACAMGWSTVVFPDELTFNYEGMVVRVGQEKVHVRGFPDEYAAIAQLYDLSDDDTYDLFGPHVGTRLEKVEQIYDYVNKHTMKHLELIPIGEKFTYEGDIWRRVHLQRYYSSTALCAVNIDGSIAILLMPDQLVEPYYE